MEFTYKAYKDMLTLCRDAGYAFCGYSDYKTYDKCVILRHDVDMTPLSALKIAQIEEKMGVQSTYFILLNTELYNPAAKKQRDVLRTLHDMGHGIGLHFDEMAYEENADIPEKIKREANVLSDILDIKISEVSMHRPSKKTLDANYVIPGIVNSYSSVFFEEFKYISDSRRCWREDPQQIIMSNKYNKIHILTHPFWYEDVNGSIEHSLEKFIDNAASERYIQLSENIRDMDRLNFAAKK